VYREEFDKVQNILGRPNVCPKRKEFAFTGLIKCNECGGMITAEETVNRHGSHYAYYRCTKKKGGIKNHCGQKYVRVEDLENQISSYLEKIFLPRSFVAWSYRQLEAAKNIDEKMQAGVRDSLNRALSECKKKLDSLLHLKLKELLTDEEYVLEKSALTEKKMKLENKIADFNKNPKIWLEPSKEFFSFVNLAKKCFDNGDDSIKRQILAALGSNLFLKDRILLIEAKIPFRLIAENNKSPLGLGLVDKVRTFFADPANHFYIPALKKSN